MYLNLLDQLTLLALDDDKGNFVSDSIALPYALAGGVMMELALKEKIGLHNDRVVVKDSSSTSDIMLDKHLDIIIASNKEKKLRYWVNNFGSSFKRLKYESLDKLIDLNILERKEGKILWIIPTTHYPTQNQQPENEIRRRLASIMTHQLKPNAEDVMLLGLVSASGLIKEVFGKENRRAYKKEIKQLLESDKMGQVTSQAIQEINESIATIIAVVATTAAVTASTAS
ncbi:GOLPH3/VPS74 family protein [Fulvivirga ligni]|uniref:GOLPH3/VPS74 family protein n=1 Tax=Fulvivirga ligni TaxID=2904246 RepID=UPI001F320911|nr:GPP34 family phosphoprotein [Fulvivirga ligni]UII19144.1 GPP34 family phosphoprotein [Fulvivirga ligni]